MPIDHATLLVSDLSASKESYSKALAPLGYKVYMEFEGVAVGFAYKCSYAGGEFDKADFWLKQAESKVGLHLAFVSESAEQCRQFYEAALAAGFTDNGPPGMRPQYHPQYYAAFVLDADGNNVEAVCHSVSE